MKSVKEFLSHISDLDIKLYVDGDRLRCNAPKGILTPAIRTQLAERKAEILEFLNKVNLSDCSSLNYQPFPQIIPRPDERYNPFPLTDIQQAYWIGRRGDFELSNVSTHAYTEIDTVKLDLSRLEKAWRRLIDRHDMLRAIVLPNGQQQVLEQTPAYKIPVLDLRGRTSELTASQLAEVRAQMSHQVLPADQCPLFEIRAAQLDNHKVRLFFSFDLLIGDSWSFETLLRELVELIQDPDASFPPLELSFRDYVLAEIALRNSPLYQRSKEYWLNRVPTLPPSPELPLQKNLAAIKHPRFVRRSGKLDSDTWECLKKRASAANLTPSGLLLAAFAEVLTVWSKSPKFTINLTLFNRLPLHPQVNQIVGDFTSLTLLAVDNSGEDSFKARSRRIQMQLWEDFDHRYFGGVQVLRELARIQRRSSAVLMPIIFTSTLVNDSLSRDQTPAESNTPISRLGEVSYMLTQTPQVYLDHQVSEQAGVLVFSWDAVEELFPAGLLDDMFAAYCCFLERLANEEKLWREPTRQLLLPERLEQLAALNATNTPIPETILLHSLFFEQASRYPQQAAVVTSQQTLTYRELSNRAYQLGHQLRQLGARPNQLVAIVMHKGWEQVAATLGVLAAGAAYVPIDPDLPTERRWYLLEQTQVQWVLTQSWLDTSLEWPENVTRLCADILDSPNSSPLEWVQQPDDLAYVIFTSGSTGKPKGVAIAHRSAVNTILDINQRFNVRLEDRVFALSSLSFDLSVYDIFGTLATGGTIVIPDATATKDPSHWLQLMRQQQVTLWNSVPALMQMLVNYTAGHCERLPQSLRLVLLSGDWLPVSLPEQIRALCPDVQVVSLGGATEASIWSILYPIEQVDPTWRSIPYGRPMANQYFYVLNAALEPCPIWVPGQLYIGGIGLALGYWRDEEKTNASFMIHPRTQERLYKTGDLGRYLPDGNIEFLGREDFQVKVNGYRIELGEIEVALQQHPAVREAIVTAVGESLENRQLVAYVVPTSREAPSLFEIECADSSKVQKLWKSLVQVGQQQAQNDFWHIDLQTFSTLWKHQDRLYIISLCRALRKLGVYNSAGERYDINYLMSRCQIVPRYRKWLHRGLKELAKEGFLKQQGEAFESIIELPIVDAERFSAEVQTKLAQTNGLPKRWVDLLPVEPTETLADIITENIHSAEIYASEETSSTYDVIFAQCNAIAQEVIQTVVQALEPGRQLRILEIGGGYGTTAKHVLPLLPPKQTTYIFTDISNFFLEKATENFAEYPFVRYDLLDIENNPSEQGYELNTFDIVIAATVLHNTRSIRETLKHVRSLLVPSGLLIAIEKTKFHRSFDLNMGLQKGFERFEDERLQHLHPVLSKEQWQRVLSDLEFETSVFMNQPNSVADFIGFDVLVARCPSSVRQFKPSKLHDFLQKKLPEYMTPANYMLLDAVPLTSNGKVDRRSLAQPKSLQGSARDDKTYVAPQTETEQLLADIWAEVLRLDKVGIHANFFESGGDSLLGIQVVTKANQQGIDLKPRQIFQYPTIAKLASLVSSDRAPEAAESDTSSASLVAIKPYGTKKSLFCIHSSSGSADSFIQLSRYIGSDQPLYGLQSRGLDHEQKIIPTIEAMASHYIEAIHTVQPMGPYHLCGWSMGGIVAYEMAKQLKSRGQEVGLIALLDIMADDREKQIKALSSQVKTNEFITAALPASQADAVVSVNQGNLRAMLDYILQAYPGKVTLIKAIEQPSSISSDPYFGWRKYAQWGVEVHETPGNHFSMMATPHVSFLAKTLSRCLTN
ncbi:non-ribosomal peptide synthetase [Chroococcidiopsis sp. CCMEE 29]|uniref:non-ribosomal peptide synthetase n=1 Tax=Chroococcidiopsis sp. CCMEE 29 TaxID=155894 RepID=UPI0020212C09|nr:non-ribosomal peptide synthetase [Chroococcidiopsis sp. CCMEE 29]